MGVTQIEKAEYVAYQLEGVAQSSYKQWRNNKPLRGGTVTWWNNVVRL